MNRVSSYKVVPQDVHTKIFSFLPPKDLLQAGTCCGWMHDLSELSELWAVICRDRFPNMVAKVLSSRACNAELLHETAKKMNGSRSPIKKKGGSPKDKGKEASKLEEHYLALQKIQEQHSSAKEEVGRIERKLTVVPADSAAAEELTTQLELFIEESLSFAEQLRLAEEQTILLRSDVAMADLATSVDQINWKVLFAARLIKQKQYSRHKTKKGEGEMVAGKKREWQRQRTCVACGSRFVVEENAQGSCRYHPGKFVHDDGRCPCQGAVHQVVHNVDARIAGMVKHERKKAKKAKSVVIRFNNRGGTQCRLHYTCCDAVSSAAPGCQVGRHNWRSWNGH